MAGLRVQQCLNFFNSRSSSPGSFKKQAPTHPSSPTTSGPQKVKTSYTIESLLNDSRAKKVEPLFTSEFCLVFHLFSSAWWLVILRKIQLQSVISDCCKSSLKRKPTTWVHYWQDYEIKLKTIVCVCRVYRSWTPSVAHNFPLATKPNKPSPLPSWTATR